MYFRCSFYTKAAVVLLLENEKTTDDNGNKWTKIKQEGNFTNTTNNMKRITEKMPFLL